MIVIVDNSDVFFNVVAASLVIGGIITLITCGNTMPRMS